MRRINNCTSQLTDVLAEFRQAHPARTATVRLQGNQKNNFSSIFRKAQPKGDGCVQFSLISLGGRSKMGRGEVEVMFHFLLG